MRPSNNKMQICEIKKSVQNQRQEHLLSFLFCTDLK